MRELPEKYVISQHVLELRRKDEVAPAPFGPQIARDFDTDPLAVFWTGESTIVRPGLAKLKQLRGTIQYDGYSLLEILRSIEGKGYTGKAVLYYEALAVSKAPVPRPANPFPNDWRLIQMGDHCWAENGSTRSVFALFWYWHQGNADPQFWVDEVTIRTIDEALVRDCRNIQGCVSSLYVNRNSLRTRQQCVPEEILFKVIVGSEYWYLTRDELQTASQHLTSQSIVQRLLRTVQSPARIAVSVLKIAMGENFKHRHNQTIDGYDWVQVEFP